MVTSHNSAPFFVDICIMRGQIRGQLECSVLANEWVNRSARCYFPKNWRENPSSIPEKQVYKNRHGQDEVKHVRSRVSTDNTDCKYAPSHQTARSTDTEKVSVSNDNVCRVKRYTTLDLSAQKCWISHARNEVGYGWLGAEERKKEKERLKWRRRILYRI